MARGAFPGGVLAVGRRGEVAHFLPFGRLRYEPEAPAVEADTIYDLASLTKVVATTTVAMILGEEGRLELDLPVATYLPGFVGPGKRQVTVRQLLSHSAGLAAWAPLYLEARGPSAFLERILAMALAYPPGSQSVYSDLGILLLGEILERASGTPFRRLVESRVLEPLGLTETGFLPGPSLLPRIAPTELDSSFRHRLLWGEVHDDNAFALGGVAPHAGLFGTAPDLARFATMMLEGGADPGGRLVSAETVAAFTRNAGVPGSSRALGWDTRSPEGSSAGSLLSLRAYGHTGFTGTSLWIDPEREIFVLLLTNRVHPSRDRELIREARPALADAAVRTLEI
ncbi:MAG: serine hydrolase domain-containing protein [Thermoanaerobaculia bacterium]